MRKTQRLVAAAIAMTVAILVNFSAADPVAADSGQIQTRSDLHAILGGQGVSEDFEAFSVGPYGVVGLGCPLLDDEVVCKGQGPGLVAHGVSFTAHASLGWHGAWPFSPTKGIVSFDDTPSDPAAISIDFTVPATAFGLDLWGTHASDTATVQVFGSNDEKLLGEFAAPLSWGPNPKFIGWADTQGIGLVVLHGTMGLTPIVDDLEFGATDTTPPVVTCGPGVNPGGQAAPNSRAGFRQVFASDDSDIVSLVITDGTFTSGELVDGDYVKLTVALDSAGSEVRPGPGVLVATIETSSQPMLVATDEFGNSASVSCGPLPPATD